MPYTRSHIWSCVGINSSPRRTPSQVQSVTAAPSRTSTPSWLSERRAACDSEGCRTSEQPLRALNENDTSALRIDRLEVGRKRPFSELGNCAGHLDAGWAAATTTNVISRRVRQRRSRFRRVECKQDAATQIGRVVDGFQPGRKRAESLWPKYACRAPVASTK